MNETIPIDKMWEITRKAEERLSNGLIYPVKVYKLENSEDKRYGIEISYDPSLVFYEDTNETIHPFREIIQKSYSEYFGEVKLSKVFKVMPNEGHIQPI